jgi:hypothetical protein
MTFADAAKVSISEVLPGDRFDACQRHGGGLHDFRRSTSLPSVYTPTGKTVTGSKSRRAVWPRASAAARTTSCYAALGTGAGTVDWVSTPAP